MGKDYLLAEGSDIQLHSGDVVTISSYGDTKWIVKQGWYVLNTARKNGWYFLSIADKSVLPAEIVDLSEVSLTDSGIISTDPDSYHDSPVIPKPNKATTKSNDECKYITIPNTSIRLYDGDIVKISKYPKSKWIVHCGWYIDDNRQNYGWYLCNIKSGKTIPLETIDLTTCTLLSSYTQGSTFRSGPELNYTRPFTDADAEMLNRTFITLDSIEQRDNLDKGKLVNGRIVRINDETGKHPSYYVWDVTTETWIPTTLADTIIRVSGSEQTPVILSELDPTVYLVMGYYKVSLNSDIENTPSDILSIVTSDGTDVYVKTLDGNSINDYVVDINGDIVIYTEYAAKNYVDERFNNLTAADVHYDNSSSSLSSTDVQGAIDELALGGGAASKTVYITETPGTSEDTYSTRYGIYQGAEGTPSSPVPSEMLANIDIPKGSIVSGTVSYWQTHGNVISTKDVLYIYTDWKQDAEGKNIPGIKVGDGLAYISDMPFTDELWAAHVMDSLIHVSAGDRANWNSKVRCYIDPNNTENMIFTTIPIL